MSMLEAAARALAEQFGPLPWDEAAAEDKAWRYEQAEKVLAAAFAPTDALVETVARATHAHNNSGTDPKWKSRLSWETEQPALKEWHRKMARAALAALRGT